MKNQNGLKPKADFFGQMVNSEISLAKWTTQSKQASASPSSACTTRMAVHNFGSNENPRNIHGLESGLLAK
jgi:hypothetical protein